MPSPATGDLKAVTERSSLRALYGRVGALESWARTPDRAARTAPARQALRDKFEREVDPEGLLPPAERAVRAEYARRAYYARLAAASAKARAAKKTSGRSRGAA